MFRIPSIYLTSTRCLLLCFFHLTSHLKQTINLLYHYRQHLEPPHRLYESNPPECLSPDPTSSRSSSPSSSLQSVSSSSADAALTCSSTSCLQSSGTSPLLPLQLPYHFPSLPRVFTPREAGSTIDREHHRQTHPTNTATVTFPASSTPCTSY